MASANETQQALLDAIAKMAPDAPTTTQLLELAEAWAWCHRPGQAHGGSVTVTSK